VSEVIADQLGATVRITLNRPERLNAVSEPLYVQLLGRLKEAESDAEVRAVLLTGSGRAFCVGADLKDHAARRRTPAEQRDYVALGQEVCRQIQCMSTPVVAQVRGYAVGAGAEMAVSADFLVMAEDAQMGFPEVSIGTFVGGGVTYRLARLVGLRRATDLLMLGERFTGAQALGWGLAYAAPPADDLEGATERLLATLASKSPLSLGRMKVALAQNLSLDAALRAEADALLAMMQTADWAEGVAAFAERRTPNFPGR
jgi:enoyl-CoA hydratase